MKIGDKIIVTRALGYPVVKAHPDITGQVVVVTYVDNILTSFPYKIKFNNVYYWVEGVPYSPLMLELL